MTTIIIGLKGGRGSGNWGHASRPGKEGGSLPKGVSSSGASISAAAPQPGGAITTPLSGITLPSGLKTPPLLPKDATGLNTYKQWYQAQAASGHVPSLSQAIAMRVALANAAQNEPAPTKPAAAQPAKPAEPTTTPAPKGKGGKGKGGAKKKAEAKPKAGKGGGKAEKPKQPGWQKGLVEPPIMSGTQIPEAKYEERGEDTFKQWLDTNSAAVAKMTDTDKQEVYSYFVKRSQNLAKDAADPWAQVYIPDKPYSMLAKGIDLPSQNVVDAMFAEGAKRPNDALGGKLWDYLDELGKSGKQAWQAWYAARINAEHQKSIIPRTKPSPAGTKEVKPIKIIIGLKGSATSGNFGHAGRLGKVGGSVPKSNTIMDADKAIRYYAGGGYRTINNALRKSKGDINSIPTELGRQSATMLDSLMEQSSLDEPVTVTRLFYGGAESLMKDIKPGDVFTDYGFSSTTTNDYKPFNKMDAGFVIQLDKGDKALSISTVAKRHATERELLLPRGTQFTVLSREDTGTGLRFNVAINRPANIGVKGLKRIVIGLKGGPGSGNWGHAGRSGKVGGSLPKATAMSITTGRDWQQRQQVKIVMARQTYPSGGFATVEDAQTWANKAYPETRFTLSDAGTSVINPSLRAYTDVAKQFPEVAKQVKSVEVKPLAVDVVASTNGNNIQLNQAFFKRGEAAAELRASTRAAVKAGYYPAGVGVNHYVLSAYGSQVMTWLDSSPIANAKLTGWLNTNLAQAKQLSLAATLGRQAFFSELFSAAYGTKNKTPLVNEFRSLVNDLSNLKRNGMVH